MNDDTTETNKSPKEFDFSAFPTNTLFHERRTGKDRRKLEGEAANSPVKESSASKPANAERRVRKERRKRIDPTTFEKQYTEDELEFMGAMQRFKERTGKPFPTYGEVLKVAAQLGYRRVVEELEPNLSDSGAD